MRFNRLTHHMVRAKVGGQARQSHAAEVPVGHAITICMKMEIKGEVDISHSRSKVR
jgi:hypothetical protein